MRPGTLVLVRKSLPPQSDKQERDEICLALHATGAALMILVEQPAYAPSLVRIGLWLARARNQPRKTQWLLL
jgi:hypothetical protein